MGKVKITKLNKCAYCKEFFTPMEGRHQEMFCCQNCRTLYFQVKYNGGKKNEKL